MSLKKYKKSDHIISNPSLTEKYPDLLDYSLISILGCGSFGQVIHAQNPETNQDFAIKILEKNNLKGHNINHLMSEAKILSTLTHKNIVKFLGAREKKDYLYIFTERVKYGSLLALMKKRMEEHQYFNDEEASKLMKNIMEAVHYIHNKDIVHRDLKPGNILIDDSFDLNSVKVTDFGLSAMVSEYSSRFFTEQCGTPLYMAPELIQNKLYSKPVDVWSCGIIMFCIINKGKHPFQLFSKEKILEEIIKGEWTFSSCFTNLAKDFFLKLCNKEPFNRYTAAQALEHPWITRNIQNNIPLTYDEQHKIFLKELEITNIFKMVYFLKHVQKQARLSNKVKTHSIFSPNFLSINKEFFLKRPKSLCGISRENFKEQLFKLQIEFSDNNKEEIDNTEKEPLSASITLSKTKEMIESSPLLRKTIISKGKDVSPEKKSLRIRSITNNYIKTSIKSLDMKEKNSDSNFKDSLFLSKTPGAEKKQHIFNYPSTILKKNIQFSYQDSIFKLNNEKKKMFVSPKNKKIEEFKGYMEKKNIREKSKDKEKISLNSSPLNSLSVNKKDIYILQKNIRFLRETNGDLNALAKRETTSNSPIKKKQLMNNNNNNTNQKLKTLKDLKSISDIDIDKESLMQLNRYTNQFFAQKVKETIFNNNNSKSNEKKLENFKFIRANGKKSKTEIIKKREDDGSNLQASTDLPSNDQMLSSFSKNITSSNFMIKLKSPKN